MDDRCPIGYGGVIALPGNGAAAGMLRCVLPLFHKEDHEWHDSWPSDFVFRWKLSQYDLDRLKLKAVLDHLEELRVAWERGILREADSLIKGGTRSNNNVEMMVYLREVLQLGQH